MPMEANPGGQRAVEHPERRKSSCQSDEWTIESLVSLIGWRPLDDGSSTPVHLTPQPETRLK